MPRRFRVFERLAFAVVTLFGLACFSVVVCQEDPELLQAVSQAMTRGGDLFVHCPARQPSCLPDLYFK